MVSIFAVIQHLAPTMTIVNGDPFFPLTMISTLSIQGLTALRISEPINLG